VVEPLFKKILCPIDFSRISIPAIELARKIALRNDAMIVLLYVVATPDPVQSQHELERDVVLNGLRGVAHKWLEGKVRYDIVVRSGEPAATIVEAERQLDVDAVVMATHGRTELNDVRLGSVTEQVVRRSTCPVITLRPQ